jgi:hypothetical protein
MNRIVASCLVVLLSLTATLAHAGVERAGTTAANFLTLGMAARVLGMAGATLGLSNGLAGTAWNPGVLGNLREGEITFSHAGLEDGASQDWAGLGGKLGVGDLRWSLTGLYQSEGTFEGRDASNNSTGSFEVASMALGGALARPLGRHASFGVGAKWVSENLGPGFSGTGVAFDAGALFRFGMLGIGLAGQNLGGSMTFGQTSFPMSSNWGGGVSLHHPGSGLAADVDFNVPNDYYANLRGGVEWAYRERIALRAGYRRQLGGAADDALNGPAFGMGAGAYGFWLDYGLLVTQGGDGQHRMSLSLLPGRMNLSPGDPFGQKNMPREFGPPPKPAESPTEKPAKQG